MDQIIDWLNENENRAYPLLEDSKRTYTDGGLPGIALPDDFLIDAQMIYTSHTLDDPFMLKRIDTNEEGTVTAIFGTATGPSISFPIPNAYSRQYPTYIRHTGGSLAVFGSGVSRWPMLGLYGAMILNIPLEPSVCYQFTDAWLGVNSIGTAPEKKTIIADYKPLLPLEAASSANTLTGDVKFLEGYNFRVNINNNLIDLEVSPDYGLHMDCTTSFIADEYKDCADIVSYINGLPPDSSHNFRLLSGANINVTTGDSADVEFSDLYELDNLAQDHSLFVGLTFQTTDLCAPVNITPNAQ